MPHSHVPPVLPTIEVARKLEYGVNTVEERLLYERAVRRRRCAERRIKVDVRVGSSQVPLPPPVSVPLAVAHSPLSPPPKLSLLETQDSAWSGYSLTQ